MQVSRLRKALLFVIAASALGLGCELIVDFDRTKIPVEGSDGAVVVPDGSSVDAPIDTNSPDTSTVDAADAADTSMPDTSDAAEAG
jgi:hypothetical protein